MGKLSAWKELLKIGRLGSLRQDINHFFRENVLSTFESEGLFSFLMIPHSKQEIMVNFHYTDGNFLDEVLKALTNDEMLIKVDGKVHYQPPQNGNGKIINPRVFSESLVDLFKNYAKAMPGRLRGQYVSFSSGINLFNWDDALASKMYTQIRKSALNFANVTRKPCKFLDVGCGNGYTTTAIWNEYFQRGLIKPGVRTEINGIDPDTNLLKIAEEENYKRITKITGKTREDMKKYEPFFPRFQVGNAENIPFEDEYFDAVYASQVLHWTDTKKSIKEMLRVTRKGGKVFGTENLYPSANRYNDLHFKVVQGAQGFFYNKDLVRWGYEAGAKKIQIATPISVFLLKK